MRSTGRGSYQAFWATNAIRVQAGDSDWPRTRSALGRGGPVRRRSTTRSRSRRSRGQTRHEVNAVEWGVAEHQRRRRLDRSSASPVRASSSPTSTPASQYDHPALVDQYRGNNGDGTFDHNYNWFDAARLVRRRPCDDDGHGTHTMGTMVGDDGGGQPDRRRPGRQVDRRQRLLPLRRGADRLRPVDARADRPGGREPRRQQAPPHRQQLVGHDGPSNDPFMEDISRLGRLRHLRPVVQRQQRPRLRHQRLARQPDSTTRPAPTTSTTSIAELLRARRRPGRRDQAQHRRRPASTSAPACPAAPTAPSTARRWPSPHVAGAVALLWSAAPR